MENFFTKEDKKTLNVCANFLRSQALKRGEIEIHQGDDYLDYDYDPFDEYSATFSNKWTVQVPAFFVPIIRKVMKEANKVYKQLDFDFDLNSHRIEFEIDAVDRQVSVDLYGYYYGTEDAGGVYWENDDAGLEAVINEIKEVSDQQFVELRYNGGGDSGYLEGSFESGERVPASVEDWCYTQLENNFGGWEINEGSDGKFEFNMVDKVCNLYHTYNTEESVSENLFREKF